MADRDARLDRPGNPGSALRSAGLDVPSAKRDLRGCPREPDCAIGAQPMPVGLGERMSLPGRPKGESLSVQREGSPLSKKAVRAPRQPA
jgi:hypothetical protein